MAKNKDILNVKVKKISPEMVYREAVANGGKIEPAAIAAGLSPAYARSGKFQKTKGWQDLVSRLTDDLLADVQLGGLNAERDDGKPDHNARARYLDMAYKVKGTYAPEKHVNLNIEPSPEAQEKARKALKDAL